jgi:hypothetical protein
MLSDILSPKRVTKADKQLGVLGHHWGRRKSCHSDGQSGFTFIGELADAPHHHPNGLAGA